MAINKQTKKVITTILKIGLTVGLLYYVFFVKLDLSDILSHYKKIDLTYLALAVLFFVLSQVVSILRLDIYLQNTDIDLSFKSNARLYLLGMFYNTFVPGGVGGDAYKVYVLKKKYKKTVKSLTEAVFLDRFIGLAAIFVIICELFFFVEMSLPLIWKLSVLIAGVVGFLLGPYVLGLIFPKHKNIYFKTLFYSLIVQGLQVIMLYMIMLSLDLQADDYLPYILMFLVSSVLSVISFGGFGIREAVFAYGGKWFHFDQSLSTSVGLMFSLITIFISFIGIIYLFKEVNVSSKAEKKSEQDLQ